MNKLNRPVKLKTLLIIVSIAMTVIMGLGALTAGFTILKPNEIIDYHSPKVNEDNLFNVEHLLVKDMNTGYGVKFDVNEENGSIKLKGTASDEIEVDFAQINLNAGTYTISAIEDGTKSTYYVTANVGGEDFDADFTPGNTFEVLSDNTTVTLRLHIAKDVSVDNVVVYPVIVSGEEAGSFFE